MVLVVALTSFFQSLLVAEKINCQGGWTRRRLVTTQCVDARKTHREFKTRIASSMLSTGTMGRIGPKSSLNFRSKPPFYARRKAHVLFHQ